MRASLSFWAFCLLLWVAASGAAQAQFDDDWRAYRSDGNAQPLERILPRIRREHPGQFYDAEGPFLGSDGQVHYRLKWMTPEGRVVWYDTDARTGRVLGSGGGRRGFDRYGDERGYDDGPPRNMGEPNLSPFGPANRGGPRGWDFGGGHRWGGGFWGGGRRHGH